MLHKNVHCGIRVILKRINRGHETRRVVGEYCSACAASRSRSINKLMKERVLLKN